MGSKTPRNSIAFRSLPYQTTHQSNLTSCPGGPRASSCVSIYVDRDKSTLFSFFWLCLKGLSMISGVVVERKGVSSGYLRRGMRMEIGTTGVEGLV